MNLIEHLQQVPDFRTQPRYPLWVILVVIIMGTMSGCTGYRGLEDLGLTQFSPEKSSTPSQTR